MESAREFRKGKYIISTDINKLDIAYIHDYLCNQSYWAAGIPLETVKKSIEGSLCFGVFYGDAQIGFARVISDKATYGYLADVFIDAHYRGKGLGKWMMELVMSYPELQGFRNWMLGTKDAHGLYAQYGFTALTEPERIMRRNDPEVYSRLRSRRP